MSERLNLMTPQVAVDPYPVYAELRRSAPVSQVDPGGMWAVTRYDDVVAVLKDPQRFSSSAYKARRRPDWLEHDPFGERIIVSIDPPDHSKMRSLVSRPFGPSGLARLEPWIREQAADLAERVVRKGEVDFMTEFALIIPATVICQLLGMDVSLASRFKGWADNIALLNGAHTPEQIPQIKATLEEMVGYFEEVIAARRRAPGEDMVSHLLAASEGGERLSHEDVLGFLRVLLLAGLETTVHLIGNTLATLANHPAVTEQVLRDQSLIPALIEEVMRYETPVQFVFRRATEDVELSGGRIPAGAMVLVLLGSANRDERRFEDPDVFRLDREDRGNLPFGHGHHYCLGAGLARLEARLALEALFSRIRGFRRTTTEPPWRPSLNMRGPAALRIRFDPA